jgi:hypothetical protein
MSEEMSYNTTNDLNEAIVDNILMRPQIVKMDEQRPINDTKCKHENLVADLDDTIGDAVYHGCANYKCGVGFYILPAKNKNIT